MNFPTNAVQSRLLLTIVVISAPLMGCNEWDLIAKEVKKIPQCKYILDQSSRAAIEYYHQNKKRYRAQKRRRVLEILQLIL